MSKRDYYEILGVQRDAGETDIKSAYRKLALKNHPDRNPGDAAAEDRFKEAAEAYGVLGDQEKRARYDRFGHAGVSGAGAAGVNPDIFTDFSDILGDFFGFGGGGGRRGGPMRGADLRFDLEITFQDSFAGSETTIQIPREESCETCKGSGAAPGTTKETCSQCNGRGEQRYQQGFMVVARTCSRCQGTGQIVRHPCMVCRGTGRTTKDRRVTVKIPAGIADGQQLRMYGEGEHGSAGGPSGDLYVVIHVAADPQFHRNGDDLYLEVPVPFYMMALGGSFKVDGPAGEITVHVSAGSADGTLVSFHGKGVPSVSGRGRGTLFVRLVVDVPKKMSKEHKKLIEQLGKLEPVEKLKARTAGAEQDKPFFEKVKDLFGEYPAIDLIWRVVPDDAHVERLLAEIDDEHPTAVEPRDGGVRVFFPTAAARDRAAPLLCSHDSSLTCTPLSVPDEDWAARSQASLGSVRVGRIVVTPPHAITPGWDDGAIGIVIQPSMGFGTGHHATTRRCLELMQQIDLSRASVLDVGTGSGILAIAGAKLGATRVIGVDHDPDALTAAAENVERNAVDVTLENIDLSESPLPDAFDLVVANLTGATLERFAAQLTSALAPNGHLIVSGLLATEEAGVQTALESRGLRVVAKAHEEEWVALQLRRRSI